MWLLDRLLSKAIHSGALDVVDAHGTIHRYGPAPYPPAEAPLRLRFTDAATTRAIGRNAALAVGEAYMDGRVLIERGSLLGVLDLVTRNLRWSRDNQLRVDLWGKQRLLAKLGELNERRQARRNVAHHYDLGNRFYKLFLDAEWQYSCAYFEPENNAPGNSPDPILAELATGDLGMAQEAKLAHICRKLALRPHQRVLDIGCGWGGMARHIHKVSGAEVLGITLSEEQLRYARQRADELGIADKVRYELMDYRDVKGQFDRIVSVGMFEHVGRPNYQTFFEQVASLLRPDGIALLHCIGRMGGPGVTDPWTRKYIFPGGYVPALSEIVPHIERAWLWTTDIEVWRLHYAKTLAHWLAHCEEHRAEIIALYDERFFRMWEFYLAGSLMAFRNDDHVVFQIQLARERDSLPLTRRYMEDRGGEIFAETDGEAPGETPKAKTADQ